MSIDFLGELNRLRYCSSPTKFNDGDHNDMCMIGGDKLTADCITLPCNHRFNYDNLFSSLQTSESDISGVYCPYCLRVSEGTLPIREKNGVFMVHFGINTPISECLTDEHQCGFTNQEGVCRKPVWVGHCLKHNKYVCKLLSFLNDYEYSKLEYVLNDKKMIGMIKKLNSIRCATRETLGHLINETLLKSLKIPLLRLICKLNCITGYSKLKKKELIDIILTNI